MIGKQNEATKTEARPLWPSLLFSVRRQNKHAPGPREVAASYAQALEFDVNQSVNGRKYIFGTECNIAETHTWRIWDPAAVKWVNSGVPCAKPTAYQWHHVVWEFRREGNNVVYVSVSVDGQKSYVNRQFTSLAVNARELNVAFQMDGNYNQTDYSVWLDKVTLNYW